MLIFRLLVIISLLLVLPRIDAKASEEQSPPEIHVAVASNFAHCFASLAEDFTHQTGIKVLASPGSTGRHFAQIKAGAPYNVFLAADAHRPELLEECGIAISGTRFTYAVGRLVFLCPKSCGNLSENQTPQTLTRLLTRPAIKHLAVANPRLAPYGKAAKQVLLHLGLLPQLEQSLVTGQNISQAWQFVTSGNAEAGLVALSQVMDTDPDNWCPVPSSMHDPIIQQGVLLEYQGQENQREAAQRLLHYLKSPAANKIMAAFGYENDDETKQ